ncbi:stalk domain-containing protein [Paenibacillus amylolyticus]|nr:stalk domain-containing protein [Paenibacillus amylolyticus]
MTSWQYHSDRKWKKVTLPAAPVQREGRVLIPLSSFSNQFSVQVSWNQATKMVSLSPHNARCT